MSIYLSVYLRRKLSRFSTKFNAHSADQSTEVSHEACKYARPTRTELVGHKSGFSQTAVIECPSCGVSLRQNNPSSYVTWILCFLMFLVMAYGIQ